MKDPLLVTGAAGFIGARTAEMLLEQGHTVVGFDNLNDYYDPALKQLRLDRLRAFGDRFTFVKGDVEDADALRALFAQHRFTTVFHLAARAGVRGSVEDPALYLRTNAHGALNLLEALKERGSETHFVLASTSSLYAGQTPPFHEEMPCDRPLSPYAASKKAAEVMTYTYHHLYGIHACVLRYFTVYGPRGRPDMAVYRFIENIRQGIPITVYGDGSQARDFTYIDDIARGTIAAADVQGYEIINLGGGGEPVTINALIRMIEAAVGRKAVVNYEPFHQADMVVTRADNRRAEGILDWAASIAIHEGIRRAGRLEPSQGPQ